MEARSSRKSSGPARNAAETRQILLDAAFAEIRRAGFAGASIADILARSGLTKGALYHHFPGKAQIAHAVMDESLPAYIDQVWLAPLDGINDILPALMAQVDALATDDAPDLVRDGCPLARMAAGAPDMDDGLRKKLDGVYRYWRRGLAGHLSRSQFRHYIRTDAEPSAVAEFLIGLIQGFLTRPKMMRNGETHAAFAGEYARYLNSLRP